MYNSCSIAIIFTNFGPYHIARLKMFSRFSPCKVYPIQLSKVEGLRKWKIIQDELGILSVSTAPLEDISPSILKKDLLHILHEINPDILAIAGYSHPAIRSAATWAKRKGKITILMSDSQYIDRPRNWFKEKIKGLWIKRYFDAAFVGGERSADYLIKLGFPAERIWRGYDVVGNDYFTKKREEIRVKEKEWREKLNLPEGYFLYVGRFSPEKNLLKLLKAYRIYKNKLQDSAWGLVLVGSGPQEVELKEKSIEAGLNVYFPGFKKIDELPYYYALASCFILPSTSESWGLVVNEAMASGLPVLVSWKCGCVPELVHQGINGYVFNPENEKEIAFYMERISSGGCDLVRMGEASRRIIQNFSPETWAQTLADCIEVTMRRKKRT